MENLFIYLIKASGLIGVFYFAYFLLLRKETFFSGNRWFLLLGLITSSVLPLFFITKIIWVEPTTNSFDWSNIPMTTLVSTPEPEIDWYLILAYTYFTGIAILFLKLVFDFKSLISLLKGKTIEQQGNFKLIDITENIAPFSYFNYIVYNSSLYSTTELENILEHEKVHSQQKHSIDVLISRLFCTFFWFNPLVWLYKKAIAQNLEFIADSEAAKKITDKKVYQLTLLKITTQENCVALTNHFYQSLIKKRIVMLNKNQSKKWNSWKYASVFPALVAFVFLFQIEVVAQEKIEAKPENTDVPPPPPLPKEKEDFVNDAKVNEDYLKKLDSNEAEKTDSVDKSDKPSILLNTIEPPKPPKAPKTPKLHKISDKDIYINGVKLTNEDFSKLDKNTIKNSVLITKNTLAQLDDKNNVQTILKQEEIQKPLIVLDGIQKESNFKIEEIPTDKIDKIDVLKGINAITKYGESGKNGVIEITSKEKTGTNDFKPLPLKKVQGFQLLKQN